MNTTNQSRFILARAAALLVEAYKLQITEYQKLLPLKTGIHHDAPSSYEQLKADAMEGRLNVSPAFNTTSIYGAAGNIAFRVFHDYGHLLYGCRFTTPEEIMLAKGQWLDIKHHIPAEWQAVCKVVYLADTVEQSAFEAQTGHFPHDQKAFVLEALVMYMDQADEQ